MKKTIIGAAVTLVVVSSLFFCTAKMTQAQGDSSGADITKKLNEILDNQKSMMSSIASMQGELKIIKIRITQQQ